MEAVEGRSGVKTYIGSGDRGRTSLLSGERVAKTDLRVEACGEVDELNSVLGALVAALPEHQGGVQEEIQRIQADLFHVGAWLATIPGSPTLGMLQEIGPEHTKALEAAIDRLETTLPPLRSFILPGGHPTAAWAHIARAVCRRAERQVLHLAMGEPSERLAGVITFLNRLSDYLFVLGRYCNRLYGVPDTVWQK
jgi:cob(I)alamin adenosyltransferase